MLMLLFALDDVRIEMEARDLRLRRRRRMRCVAKHYYLFINQVKCY